MTRRTWGQYLRDTDGSSLPLQRRGDTIYVIKEIPKALRPKFGRARFVQSLGTDSIKKAKALYPRIVAEWTNAILVAKGEPDDAAAYREALRKARAANDTASVADVMASIELEHENIAHSASFTVNAPIVNEREANEHFHAEAEDFAARATGLKQSLSDHIDPWVAASDYTARIKDEAKGVGNAFVSSNKRLSDFTRPKLQAYVNNLVHAGRSSDTIKKHISYLKNLWHYLQRTINEEALYRLNPFEGVQKPKRKNGNGKKRLAFSQDDFNKLLKATKGSTLHGLIKLAAYTGCRLEELCSLQTKDVHVDASIPYIHIAQGKTENATRDIPIHKAILPLVRMMKKASTDGFMFSNQTADKYGDRSEALGKQFGELKTALGYGEAHTFHSLRHMFISALDAAEVSKNARKWIVGHRIGGDEVEGYLHPRSLPDKAAALAKLPY